MLMGPVRELPEGAHARIRLVLADGRRVFAEFPVRREAPPR
jgi:copper(I)-binding protein